MGWASSRGCNCLINSLATLTGSTVNPSDVRKALINLYPHGPAKVARSNYLTLDHHWRDCLNLLLEGDIADGFTIVAVDLQSGHSGDVVGNGPNHLHLAWQNGNHFIPLLPTGPVSMHNMNLGRGQEVHRRNSNQY